MPDSTNDELERKLMTLFEKCTSFGFSFGHSTSKEEFAEMLSKGDSLDHQEAAHEAIQLFHQHTEQAVLDELQKILGYYQEGRTALYEDENGEIVYLDERIAQLTTNHKGDKS